MVECAEVPIFTPETIAANMLSARKVYSGVSPEAERQNHEVFETFAARTDEIEIPEDVISIQPMGSRLKGYHNPGSDLDIIIVECSEGYDSYPLRKAIDDSLLLKTGVHSMHGSDGLLDVDRDVHTWNIGLSVDEFIEYLYREPEKYAYLFESGGYESTTLTMARTACVSALADGKYFSQCETDTVWRELTMSFAGYFINGRIASDVAGKIIREIPFAIWDNEISEMIRKYPALRKYAYGEITNQTLPEYVDPEEFIANLMEGYNIRISEALQQERVRRFGLPPLAQMADQCREEERSLDDDSVKSSKFYEAYRQVLAA